MRFVTQMWPNVAYRSVGLEANLLKVWWTWRGSNSRPHDCQSCHLKEIQGLLGVQPLYALPWLTGSRSKFQREGRGEKEPQCARARARDETLRF
jgi:hypothetical protein